LAQLVSRFVVHGAAAQVVAAPKRAAVVAPRVAVKAKAAAPRVSATAPGPRPAVPKTSAKESADEWETF